MNHHSMTEEQREILNQDLATIMQRLGDIATLLNACYGSKDPRLVRAEEAQAALQRLLWALEQQSPFLTIADGSARVSRDRANGRKGTTNASGG
jgi:hypothetical protein